MASNGTPEALFTAQREAEWAEFVSDCGKYEAARFADQVYQAREAAGSR